MSSLDYFTVSRNQPEDEKQNATPRTGPGKRYDHFSIPEDPA
jgi:hypothetical protein